MTAEQASSGRAFELIERIGAGAYGEVYLAESRSGEAGFTRRVAVKVLHAHRRDEATNRRIRDEARILGHIHHRSVVTVLDLVRLGERWAVVMDFVPGGDLEQIHQALEKAGERMAVGAALAIGAEISAALHAAFVAMDGGGRQLGVVHRDIKPSNVRITPDGDVKVLDFGLAWVDLPTREAESGELVVGTRRYMSPERLNGDPGGPEGDVYAAAKLVAELLAGRVFGTSPADDEAHDGWVRSCLAEVEAAVGPGPTLSLLAPLLQSALATEPDQRPKAAELADQLGYLARSVPDASLEEFAAAFLPRMETLAPRASVPATGVLREASSGAARYTPLPLSLERELPPRPTPPLSDSVSDALSDASSGGAVFVARRSSPWALVIALVALLAAVSAVGVVLMSGGVDNAEPVEATPEVQSFVGADRPPPAAPEPIPAAPEPVQPAVIDPSPRPRSAPRTRPSPAPTPIEVPRVAAEPLLETLAEGDAVVEAAQVSEPVEVAVVAEPVVEPEPVVELQPAEPRYPKIGGSWVGVVSGRPLTLRISGAGPSITATAELVQGPTIRTVDLSGTVTEAGAVILKESGKGMAFRGTLGGGAMTGFWQLKEGGKRLSFEVRRP
ncbi:MAG: serine/threonine protein kinase [Proteobacteria bacterium]|nr:serine/threonine protein kinase [Pseudomonadota bacterium]